MINNTIVQILTRFFGIGIKLYLVGGSIRDILMGNEPKDLDFTTPLDNEGISYFLTEDKMPKWYVSLFSVNKQHLTQTVRYKDDDGNIHDLEITQFRTDDETDGRHAKCTATTSIEEDLLRRDFTINAIAYDHITDTYIDPFNGQEDINNKILRCVGDPMARFEEDELRPLRLFRFEARFGKGWTIDPATLDAAMKFTMENISDERIVSEISKVFGDPNADCELFLDRLYQHGVLKRCLPDLWALDRNGNIVFCDQMMQTPVHHEEGDVWTHIKIAVQSAHGVEGRWIALLHDIAKPCTAVWDYLGKGDEWYSFPNHDHKGAEMIPGIVKRLKLSTVKEISNRIDTIAAICTRWHMDIYKFCANVGEPKKDGKGNIMKDKNGKPKLIEVKQSRVREVQADFAKSDVPLHYMEDLAKADHMGRPVTKGVDKFWKEVPAHEIERVLNGDDLQSIGGLQPGPDFKHRLDTAYRYQLKHNENDVMVLLSVALNYKEEDK